MILIYIALSVCLISAMLIRRLVSRYSEANEDLTPIRGTRQEVEYHLRRGQKISAIKAYRQMHGCGLAEAKEAVEQFQRG